MFLWLFSLEPSIPATQIHRARIAGLCWLSLRIQRPQGRHWPIATYQFMVEAEDLCGLVSLDSFDTSSSLQGALSCSSSCNASDWPQSVTRCLVGTKDIPVVSSSFMVFFGGCSHWTLYSKYRMSNESISALGVRSTTAQAIHAPPTPRPKPTRPCNPDTPWDCHICLHLGWCQGGQCKHIWHTWSVHVRLAILADQLGWIQVYAWSCIHGSSVLDAHPSSKEKHVFRELHCGPLCPAFLSQVPKPPASC